MTENLGSTPSIVVGGWRTSSRSSGGGNCVQVAADSDGTVRVRDSKNPAGPVLTFTTDAWRVFTIAVHAGEFDLDTR